MNEEIPRCPEKHCPDCLAHYTGEHTCPPWMKALNKSHQPEKSGAYGIPNEWANQPSVVDSVANETSQPECGSYKQGFEDGKEYAFAEATAALKELMKGKI